MFMKNIIDEQLASELAKWAVRNTTYTRLSPIIRNCGLSFKFSPWKRRTALNELFLVNIIIAAKCFTPERLEDVMPTFMKCLVDVASMKMVDYLLDGAPIKRYLQCLYCDEEDSIKELVILFSSRLIGVGKVKRAFLYDTVDYINSAMLDAINTTEPILLKSTQYFLDAEFK